MRAWFSLTLSGDEWGEEERDLNAEGAEAFAGGRRGSSPIFAESLGSFALEFVPVGSRSPTRLPFLGTSGLRSERTVEGIGSGVRGTVMAQANFIKVREIRCRRSRHRSWSIVLSTPALTLPAQPWPGENDRRSDQRNHEQGSEQQTNRPAPDHETKCDSERCRGADTPHEVSSLMH